MATVSWCGVNTAIVSILMEGTTRNTAFANIHILPNIRVFVLLVAEMVIVQPIVTTPILRMQTPDTPSKNRPICLSQNLNESKIVKRGVTSSIGSTIIIKTFYTSG